MKNLSNEELTKYIKTIFPLPTMENQFYYTYKDAGESIKTALLAKLNRIDDLEKRDETWRAKKEQLENDLAKAWQENKELKEMLQIGESLSVCENQFNDEGGKGEMKTYSYQLNPNNCQYRLLTWNQNCRYQGYCDYKLPRDSRKKKVTLIHSGKVDYHHTTIE